MFMDVLHSHSGLEKALNFPKHIVLIDASFGSMFNPNVIVPFRANGKDYYKVDILLFVKAGGQFKNFDV